MATQEALLTAAVVLLSGCLAVPYGHGNPAVGRQFLYPGYVPAPAPHYAAPVPAAYHLPHNNLVYYAPPTAANLVAPVPSALRYATVIAPPPPAVRQQFLYYPQVHPGVVPGNVIVYGPRDENEEQGGGNGYYESFVSLISNYIPTFGENKPAEAENPPAEAEKPVKVEAAAEGEAVSSPQTVDKTDNEPDKESEVTNADTTRRQDVPQRVVLYGQPQFYGNYASLQQHPAAALPSADKGAVSSYLLLRNFPATANYKAQPQSPEYYTQADTLRGESPRPGSPLVGSYQKYLVLPKQRGLDSFGTVHRDAASSSSPDESGPEDSSPDSNSESAEAEKVEENSNDENGPGGVAAAAPVGTALVGPGGMALSAPSATAVAGAGKGSPSVPVSPAAQKAVKTYNLASKNPSAFINP